RGTGTGVIDVALPGLATGDEQQLVPSIKDHAKRVAAFRRVDELLRSPAANIAAEDVAREQLACIEGGTATLGDALRGFRTWQHDDAISMVRWCGCSGRGQTGRKGSQDH